MARLEVILRQVGARWVACGDGLTVEADGISEIDEAIRRGIAESGRFPAGTKVEVTLACDRGVIPDWMRPYHSHYFNRIISFVVGEGGKL
jgi:hypothetical protein